MLFKIAGLLFGVGILSLISSGCMLFIALVAVIVQKAVE